MKKQTIIIIVLLILVLICNLFQSNFWHLWYNLWYHADYFQFILLWYVILKSNENKWVKLVCYEGLIFNVNDVVDVLFMNPNKIEINEYIFCTLALIILIWKTRNRRKN